MDRPNSSNLCLCGLWRINFWNILEFVVNLFDSKQNGGINENLQKFIDDELRNGHLCGILDIHCSTGE